MDTFERYCAYWNYFSRKTYTELMFSTIDIEELKKFLNK